jgi:hypothetical protein
MDRRTFLAGAVALTGVATAGCNDRAPDDPTAPPRTDPDADGPSDGGPAGVVTDAVGATAQPEDVAAAWGFDSVVDVVDAGADPEGSTPVDDVLSSVADDGALLVFPSGRYRVEGEFNPDAPRIGILGDGATIVPADGFDDVVFGLGYRDAATDVLVSGIAFDFRADDTGGRPLLARADRRIVASDLSVVGEVDVQQDLFRFDVTGGDGSGVVRGLRLTDGAAADVHVTGIQVGDDNEGDIDFVDCHVAGFTDNGLYADPPTGSVRVLGGTYVNNGVAGVRLEATEGRAVARNVYVRCDDADAGGENMRGIRLRAGNDVLVENCVVELVEVSSSDGAVTFASELDSATVRDCSLHVDADDVNAIRIKSGAGSGTEGPFRCENVTVTGAADGGACVDAANRVGCAFRGLSIYQSGDDRDGIMTDNVVGELRDAYVAVTGQPLRFENSDISQSNVALHRVVGD